MEKQHLTVGLLSGNPDIIELITKSWGKRGTQSDILLLTLSKPYVQTTVIPLKYPDKPIPLVLATHMAEIVLIPIPTSGINAEVAESSILADCLQIPGVLAIVGENASVFQDYFSKFDKLFQSSFVTNYPKLFVEPHQLNEIKEKILASKLPPYVLTGPPIVEVDHIFTVQGVGAVILGTLLQGTIKKGDKIICLPEGVTGVIKSIQLNDVDVHEVSQRSHVGLALRGVLPKNIERGTLITTDDSSVKVINRVNGLKVKLAPMFTSINEGEMLHAVFGIAHRPIKVTSFTTDKRDGTLSFNLEKEVAIHSKSRITILNLNSKQRIVGSTELNDVDYNEL